MLNIIQLWQKLNILTKLMCIFTLCFAVALLTFFSLSPLANKLGLSQLSLGITIAAISILSLSWWMTSRIKMLVKLISRSAYEVGDGNLKNRIDYVRQDEAGEIFTSFNKMLDALQIYQNQQRETRGRIKELANIARENPNPVIRINNEKIVIFYNQAAKELAASLNLSIGSVVPEDFYENYIANLDNSNSKEYDSKVGEKHYKIYVVKNERLQTFNIYCWDVSGQRRAEQNLIKARDKALEAAQVKSRFLATMSHEIRTPMNGIIGLSNILADTDLNEEQKDLTNSIILSANSLLTIINDILDFSKIEAGKMSIEYTPLNLRKTINDCVDLFKVTTEQKGIDLSFEMEDSVPKYIESDPSRLRQVIINLVGNAVKFTESGSVNLFVKAKKKSDARYTLEFEVRDTGIGIPKDLQHRLFQDFSQVDGTITRKFGGTGLGLAISKSIAKLLGGDIWVTSVENKGSSFFFSIIANESVELETARLGQEEVILDENFAKSYPLRISIAEDNMVNQMVIKRYLKKLGYTDISLRENGFEIVELVTEEKFDVTLMDMQMPLMSGIEAAIEINDNDSIVNKPFIIAMTANAMAEDKKACEDAGMQGYVSKPIKIELVAEALSTAYKHIQHNKKAA